MLLKMASGDFFMKLKRPRRNLAGHLFLSHVNMRTLDLQTNSKRFLIRKRVFNRWKFNGFFLLSDEVIVFHQKPQTVGKFLYA